jgi:hypothetical protein
MYGAFTHVLQLAGALRYRTKGQQPGLFSENLPSWVPDWRSDSLAYMPLHHSPSTRPVFVSASENQTKILAGKGGTRILLATGIPVDIIIATVYIDVDALHGSADDAKKSVSSFISAVDSCGQKTGFFHDENDHLYRIGGYHFIAALAMTIVADWEHTPENSYFSQGDQFRGVFLEQLRKSVYCLPEMLHKWPAYVELIRETMRGRRLFLTQTGYIGIGDWDIQADDVVFLLSRSKIPFILRPSGGRMAKLERGRRVTIEGCYSVGSDEPGYFDKRVEQIKDDPSQHCTFRLLGDAYVQGLMKGELARRLGIPDSDLARRCMIIPIL